MTDAQLLTNWTIGLIVAAVVVVIAAALLLAVLLTARSIERGASSALGIVQRIRENTNAIWELQETNERASQLRDGAQAILSNAGALVQAMHEADARHGGSVPREMME